ncbi:MAG: hypothetical protein U0271_02380 [Polyangiaceae bacterium]
MQLREVVALGMVVVSSAACASSPQGGTNDRSASSSTSSAPTSSASAPSSSAAPRTFTRADFARRMSGVAPGMAVSQVIAALGKPSDILTIKDGISATRTTEVWRYGTEGHSSFATLGTVHIQGDGTVQYVFGGQGAPPPDGTFDEAELAGLLRTIDAVASYEAPLDPRTLIAAVNTLQALGEVKALLALREYLRVASPFDDPGREGTILIARTLFNPPASPGYFSVFMGGEPSPPAPPNPKSVPRFPVAILAEVPFNVVRGYILGGQAEPPEAHLTKVAKEGAFRSGPIVPPSDPLSVFNQALGTAKSPFLVQSGLTKSRDVMSAAVMRLLSTVFEDSIDERKNLDDEWARIMKAHGSVKVRWDAAKSQYVAAPTP